MPMSKPQKKLPSKSPVLPKGKKNYLIDIDGTITDDVPNEEPARMKTCRPFVGAKEAIGKLYEEGHVITFFTSRIERKHGKITRDWLAKHGFKYHNLLMGKPRGGHYHWIDNHKVKTTLFKKGWEKMK